MKTWNFAVVYQRSPFPPPVHFLVVQHHYITLSTVLRELSKTMIRFFQELGQSTAPMEICKYVALSHHLWTFWNLFTHYSITSLPLLQPFLAKQEYHPKTFHVGQPSNSYPFFTPLTRQRIACIASIKQRFQWSTQILWSKSVSVEKCKIPSQMGRNEVRDRFSPCS